MEALIPAEIVRLDVLIIVQQALYYGCTEKRRKVQLVYYYTTMGKSNIVHTEDCSCVRSIHEDNLGSFDTIEQAYRAGYILCKRCDPLRKKYDGQCSEILHYCANNGLSCRLNRRGVTIWTPRSEWKIIVADNGVGSMLYHKNNLHPQKDQRDLVPGYHCQSVTYPTLLGYMEYIVEHDWFRMINPVYPHPKKKAPPQKGTKRYRKAQAREKKKARRESINNVINLIDRLQNTSISAGV